MSAVRRYLTLLVLVGVAGTSQAIDSEAPFEDAVLNQRYASLIREVRCLVCQNQSIADSNAALASDLRREIRDMLAAGESDRNVVDFLVARYGDFVMYRPPLKPLTWPLWGGPAVLLMAGCLIFVRTVQQQGVRGRR